MEMAVDKCMAYGMEFHAGDGTSMVATGGLFSEAWRRGLVMGYLALEMQADHTIQFPKSLWKGELSESNWALLDNSTLFAEKLTAAIQHHNLFAANQVLTKEAIQALVDPSHPQHANMVEAAPPWYNTCTGALVYNGTSNKSKLVAFKGFHAMQHLYAGICGDSSTTMYKSGTTKGDYPIRHALRSAWENNDKHKPSVKGATLTSNRD
jgi:hypothetical protein